MGNRNKKEEVQVVGIIPLPDTVLEATSRQDDYKTAA
jgi:hypothetical protein